MMHELINGDLIEYVKIVVYLSLLFQSCPIRNNNEFNTPPKSSCNATENFATTNSRVPNSAHSSNSRMSNILPQHNYGSHQSTRVQVVDHQSTHLIISILVVVDARVIDHLHIIHLGHQSNHLIISMVVVLAPNFFKRGYYYDGSKSKT